ncbi:MAG: leucine-rich repeat domain-containing protein, partial [Ureaplasma sp.]|nr:leucine-rich repeat domain-containing protein [Ureaplasma sp.]
LGDFFTPIEIDTTILDNLKDQIQSEIEKQKLTSSQKSDLDKLKTVIKNLLHTNQIEVPKYENPNLIIEPISPNKFTPSDSQWIVDGNIVIPNLKFFTLIKFSDLSKLFDALNNAIHTINNKHNSPEEFNQYTNQNLDEIKQLIYDNLGNFNKNKFNVDDILNISINENYELVIQLSTDYLRYQITNANENFELNNNKLIIKNLDFKYPYSPDSWFIYKYGKNKLWIEQLSDEGKKQSHIVIPSYVEAIYYYIHLEDSENITTLDMSFMKNYRGVWVNSTIPYPGQMISLAGCKKLEKIIFPKNLLKVPEYTFRETMIKNLIFPKSLTELDTIAFYKCSNLKWVYLSSKVQFTSATSLLRFPIRDTFNSYYTKAGMITIYVPTQELKQYYEQFNFNDARIEVRSTPPEN